MIVHGFPENILTHHTEGHWRFQGVGSQNQLRNV